jgi:superfamily II DNA or RNA helicase
VSNATPTGPRAPWGTASKLRAWQAEALDRYFETEPRDFLAAATPGAGKTTFALRLAAELRARRTIDRVTVVAPTDHLKRQWADAAARVGIRLDPGFRNAHGRTARHFHGVAVTYAQVAVRPALHRELTLSGRSLVILDEVHHGGDALSWGDAIREAFEPATRRLSLTGTPFRSDTAPIPFVHYEPDAQGIRVSSTDYDYGYGRALADGVVRPVIFMVYAGSMRWRTRAGDEMEARLGEDATKDIRSAAWRTALEPTGEWIPSVLRAADRRLTEVRHAVPDAGGLVIASDQSVARAYAEILESTCGERVTVVLSDEKEASARIEEFSNGTSRWMVAVRMVSEGVDVPRLAVGVYATSSSTPLFFAQAIGRFVRARRRGETASVFLPNVPVLMALASELERQRDHALDRRSGDDDDPGLEDGLLESANREDRASDELEAEFTWQALGSDATFDRVLYDGTEFGTFAEPGSDEELDFIGIPGILEPDQVAELLRHRQARQARRASERRRHAASTEDGGGVDDAAGGAEPVALYRTLKEQRSLLNSLVGLYARQTGQAHSLVHAELRRACGGPEVAQATVTQLQARIELLRRRLSGR